MPEKRQCEYCPRKIDPRGYQSHVHFNHVAEVVRRFRENPHVRDFMAVSTVALGLLLPPACGENHGA